MTKKEHTEHIKPVFEKLFALTPTSIELSLIGDFWIKLLKSESDIESLKFLLNSLTPIQKDFFKKYGLKEDVETLTNYLNGNDN